jgi:hypothetical protein
MGIKMIDSRSRYDGHSATDRVRHHVNFRGSAGLRRAWGSLLATRPVLVLRELARYAGNVIPGAWSSFRFRSFWGPGILSSDVYFVMDSYENVMLRSSFQRAMAPSGGEFLGGREIIHGTFAPQAAAMLTALFQRHSGKILRIATDAELGHKRNATLICYGTSDSNSKTLDVEASSGNELCQFSFDESGQRAFRLGGQLHSMENRGGITYDKAILLRLTNRDDRSHCHVVCAGLSEWGSLAAVYYLTKKWKALHQRFDRYGQRRDFCVLLEVPCGQFENAREVTSAVCWGPQEAPQAELNCSPAVRHGSKYSVNAPWQ